VRHFEVLAPCVHCHVEGAVVETFDESEACCHLGVPAETICRMCGRATHGGVDPVCSVAHALVEEKCPQCDLAITEQARTQFRCSCGLGAFATVTAEPRDLSEVAAVEKSLTAWAHADSMHLGELIATSFGEDSVEAIHAKILAGEPVTTSFDVLGFLFSHLTGGVSGMQAGHEAPPTKVAHDTATDALAEGPQGVSPTIRIVLPSTPADRRRNRILPLVSVMAADGRVLQSERKFVERVLEEEGLKPLEDHELRVHRPHEVGDVGSPEEREKLVGLMLQLAYIDQEGDSSELRVVHAFARKWGVAPERLAELERQHQPMGWSHFVFKMKSILLG
jgi:uncharacterized tellurite resistance protein B-like protein